jgi:excisionase family DNA binding protein
MMSETTISPTDVDKIRRTVDRLRALAQRRPVTGCTIASGVATVSLDADQLASVVKALESVAADGVAQDELTPQEAAAELRMSRPTVMRLIDKGVLLARLVGTHNRLPHAAVLAYREQTFAVRQTGLRNLAALTEEYNF